MEGKKQKTDRILSIYSKLMDGYTVSKAEEAARFRVDERSIQRDIDDIRAFLAEKSNTDGSINKVIYNRNQNCYKLETLSKSKLTNPEVLALCKILLESRAFSKQEMTSITEKLVSCCAPSAEQKLVSNLLKNELFYYVEPNHKEISLGMLWEIGQAIQQSWYIEITYNKANPKEVVNRKLKPLAIMFSEFYFYLTAFIERGNESEKLPKSMSEAFPTIYRIDRIQKLKVLKDHFTVPYSEKFKEGEFKKRIQFMYGGELKKLRFDFSGPSVEAVLDRLPTAKIKGEKDGIYTITAEVFGTGIDMWLRSQGEWVQNISYS